MDSNSSRGPTPGPGDPFENSGASTPDGFFPNSNGEPPQKMVKRRPSQQKRRGSQNQSAKEGGGGPSAKKRPRKNSKLEETADYDAYMEGIAQQLKNLPAVQTVEPMLSHYYNACPIYGGGEKPKMFGLDMNTRNGSLEGTYENPIIPEEGEYYDVLPFGPNPPVPNIPKVNLTVTGFYKSEFDSKKNSSTNADSNSTPSRSDSADLFYSSSPEPEPIREEKEGLQKPWLDLEPDEEDDEEMPQQANPTSSSGPSSNSGNAPETPVIKEEEGVSDADKKPPAAIVNGMDDKENEENKKPEPPKIVERPVSPSADILHPIAVRPRPKQLVSMKDLKEIELREKKIEDEVVRQKSKSFLPIRTNGSLTSLTMTLAAGNGAHKNVLKALNGLAKLLKIDPPKTWVQEDIQKKDGRDYFRTKLDENHEGDPMDMLSVVTKGCKLCRHCGTVLLNKKVKKKTADLPFMTKQEREDCDTVYFCDRNCYFHFACNRSGCKPTAEISSLNKLIEAREKKLEEEKEEAIKKEKEALEELEPPGKFKAR